MRAVLLMCALMGLAHGIRLQNCVYHDYHMTNQDENYEIAGIQCDTDEPLYYKSAHDSNVRVPMTASAAEIETAMAASSTAPLTSQSTRNLLNPEGYQIDSGDPTNPKAIPNYGFVFGNNLGVQCGDDSLIMMGKHDLPTSHLYTLRPQKNPINALWQGFGAYNFPETVVANKIAFGFAWGGSTSQGDVAQMAQITKAKITACLAAGTFKVLTGGFPTPAPSPPGPGVPQPQHWIYSDSAGNPLQVEQVTIARRTWTCDKNAYVANVQPKIKTLFTMLDLATSRAQSEGAMLTFSCIQNDVDLVGCYELLSSFYTTGSQAVTLKGIRACTDPSDTSDPCCTQSLRWSNCCMPRNASVNIAGLFSGVNKAAIGSACTTQANEVTQLIQDITGPALLETRHPERGCDVIANKKTDRRLWTQLISKPNQCFDSVQHGKTRSGQNSCNADAECWTGSCVSEGGTNKRCARVFGSAMAEPLLSCMLSEIDKEMWKFMAAGADDPSTTADESIDDALIPAGFDPRTLNPGSNDTTEVARVAEWNRTVHSFRRAIGVPSCGGQAAAAWCTVQVTKAQCQSAMSSFDWSRRLVWIDDTSTAAAADGYCRLNEFHDGWRSELTDAELLQRCQQTVQNLGGVCPGLNTHADATSCGGTWITFNHATAAAHRLQTGKIGFMNETSGNWEHAIVPGSQVKCELEKQCNWDPDGRYTGGDQTKCLQATGLTYNNQAVTISSASFVDSNGNKMACLQCWGQRCENFHPSRAPICAVAAWDDRTTCAAASGGGDGGTGTLAAVTAVTYEGMGSHYACRRDTLSTQAACLTSNFCPTPARQAWQDSNDPWIRNCEQPLCYDPTKTDQAACEAQENNVHREWRSTYKAGSGACIVWWSTGGVHTKSTCEAKTNLKWWEGRVFLAGDFNTQATCTGYCDDGNWPPAKTCDANAYECNAACAQCKADNSDNQQVCVNGGITSESTCASTAGYSWNWDGQVCLKDTFTSESDCTGNANHAYYTCSNRAENVCASYCRSDTYTSQSTCEQNHLWWDWDTQVCKHHRVNKATGPACNTLTAQGTCDAEQGCNWNNGACQGTSWACSAQAGSNTWVTMQTDAASPSPTPIQTEAANSATIRSSVMRCRWDKWARCSTQSTCVAAGECEDWYLEGPNGQGACLVAFQADSEGHRKDCSQITHPTTNTPYEWAHLTGCIAMTSVNGIARRVTESECSSITGGWYVAARAKTAAQCNANGEVCRAKYEEWDIFGGFSSSSRRMTGSEFVSNLYRRYSANLHNIAKSRKAKQQRRYSSSYSSGSTAPSSNSGNGAVSSKCEECGHVKQKRTKWTGGSWTAAAARTLYWQQRAYAKMNTWDPHAADRNLYSELLFSGIARMTAAAQKTRILCKIAPVEAAMIPVATACGTTKSAFDWSSIEYNVSTTAVSCGNPAATAPLQTGGATADFSSAACPGYTAGQEGGNQANLVMTKVTSAAMPADYQNLLNRRTTKTCARHAVIRNTRGGLVGQKMSTGTRVSGISGVAVCISTSVPDSEVCSDYTVKDIVELNSSGSYSSPLGKTVTVDSTGAWCFDGAVKDTTYVLAQTINNAVESTTITQIIKITSVTVAQYTGDVKLVYEGAYAISIGIWSSTNRAYKSGCSVSSSATAARRAGVAITFTVVIANNPSLATSSKTAATSLSTNVASFVTAITQAKTDLNKPSVSTPSASDITVAAATSQAQVAQGGSAPSGSSTSSSTTTTRTTTSGVASRGPASSMIMFILLAVAAALFK